jgi:integrase
MRQVRPGAWKLTVTLGRDDRGRIRRANRTVSASGPAAASKALAAFAQEMRDAPVPVVSSDGTPEDVTVDTLVERFLDEHLLRDRGREPRTVDGYRQIHRQWFSPSIGSLKVGEVTAERMDRLFGVMRTQGLSRSRMNQAKALYSPFFRWLKRNGVIRINPMTDFQLPTSAQVSHERVPPEVDELALLLRTAAELVPEIAPVLALGAVTGMRRGELVGLRRSRMFPDDGVLLVDAAVDGIRVKTTKTRHERRVVIDADTMAMLVEHCAEMDRRAESAGSSVGVDGFVFSTVADCSTPMSVEFLTRRVGRLKQHLGIENKSPATVSLEDEALRLRREGSPVGPVRPRPGPRPDGALSYEDIGRALDRSRNWAIKAVASAKRREAAAQSPRHQFDGSILALRKFTSSELLDAGFNISAVAQRQGHGPQVLVKHYSKLRDSADRRAAEHLGRVVNQARNSETA